MLLSKENECHHWYVEWMGYNGAHFHGVERIVFQGNSPYQSIDIYQTAKFGKLLVLDGDPQSSEHDEDIYHEALVHPSLVTHPDPRSVLILGGGEGATLREVLRHKNIEKIFMVDIDEMVVEISKKELPTYSSGGFEDKRLELIIDDAKHFLAETRETFDCVISDLTEPFPESPTHELLSEEFFRLIKSRMKPDGIFAMQGSHATRSMNNLFKHHVKIVKNVWQIVRPYKSFIPCFYSEWGFILASDVFDPLKIQPEKIDEKLSPFSAQLKYYDGIVHQAIFTLPKELRRIV